ncbi:GspMb/PilO family protein [Aquabacterium humicola]|uniref:GspMb/PilO family protein n=1 Tax=Aquabacterium humicola TaxID=3237377 RepID=UPI002543CC81|nr:GspMb/PilO family protein [Rubrivivax pictus]
MQRTPRGAHPRLRVETALQRWGWAPPVIVIVLAAAASIHWMRMTSERAALDQLQQRLSRPVPVGDVAIAQSDPTRQRIAQVQAVLPPVSAANALVGELFELAQREGLQLERSTFQHGIEDAGPRWLHVSLTLPVQGPYPAVRGFIESVLRKHPNVALNHLSVKRETSAHEQAHVVLGFGAWFASEAGPAPEAQP